MKILFVMVLLSAGVLAIIFAMDLLLHFSLKQVFYQATNSFQILDSSEYFVILCFLLLLIINLIYAKKSSNKKS
ncbi:hypothetical protein ACE38V_05100 [Cytobacillus sp. Hz8]|uniref:hypothetical protein n=1 Tax=Cytobacillus sp. Hz8 TaxID=3347168 RepID=UPI0035DB288D